MKLIFILFMIFGLMSYSNEIFERTRLTSLRSKSSATMSVSHEPSELRNMATPSTPSLSSTIATTTFGLSVTAKAILEGLLAASISFIVVSEPSYFALECASMTAIIATFEIIPCFLLIPYSKSRNEEYILWLVISLIAVALSIFSILWKIANRAKTIWDKVSILGFLVLCCTLAGFRFFVGKETLNIPFEIDLVKQLSSIAVLIVAFIASIKEIEKISMIKVTLITDGRSSTSNSIVIDVSVTKGIIFSSTRIYSTIIGIDSTRYNAGDIHNFNNNIDRSLSELNIKRQRQSDNELNLIAGKSTLFAKMCLATSISIAKAGADSKKTSLIQHLKQEFKLNAPLRMPSAVFTLFAGATQDSMPYESLSIEFPNVPIYGSLLRARETMEQLEMRLHPAHTRSSARGLLVQLQQMNDYFTEIGNAVPAGYFYEIFMNADVEKYYKRARYLIPFNGEENDQSYQTQELKERYLEHFNHHLVRSLANGFVSENEYYGFPQGLKMIKTVDVADQIPQPESPLVQVIIRPFEKNTLTDFFDHAKVVQQNSTQIIIEASPTDTNDSSIADIAWAVNPVKVKFGSPYRSEYTRLCQISRNKF